MDQSQEQLLDLFNKLEQASNANGYQVLFNQGEDGAKQPAGEEDKIKIARSTEFADFRTKRRLMEAVNLG